MPIFLPKSNFIDYFKRLNNLSDLGRWQFARGMEFGSLDKWWPDFAPRKGRHEGLDFCRFIDEDGKRLNVAGFKVPAMFDGEIIHICHDFLAHTIFVAHPAITNLDKILYSIYGHCQPHSQLTQPVKIKAGKVLARVAPAPGQSPRIAPHLHLSIAWMDAEIALEGLNWQRLNSSREVEFIDPLMIITC